MSLIWIIFSLRPPAPIWQCPGNFKLHTESYWKIIIKTSTDFCSRKMILMWQLDFASLTEFQYLQVKIFQNQYIRKLQRYLFLNSTLNLLSNETQHYYVWIWIKVTDFAENGLKLRKLWMRSATPKPCLISLKLYTDKFFMKLHHHKKVRLNWRKF